MFRTVMVAALVLAVITPAGGQEWDVTRRRFTFIDTRLTIEVAVESSGTLRLIRGMAGHLEVAGRARNGFTGFALGDRNVPELRLSALGADRVEYLVVVPENVRVRVKLPDRLLAETFGTTQDGATYEWEAMVMEEEPSRELPVRVPSPASDPLPARFNETVPLPSPTPGMFATYNDDAAPQVVAFTSAELLGRLTVRLEGDRFRIASSRPMSLDRGDPRLLEIRPAGEPMDFVIVVPSWTVDFLVEIGGEPAFGIVEGRPLVMCTPVIEQLLDDGRLWYTFTPIEGRLDCAGAAMRRGTRGG